MYVHVVFWTYIFPWDHGFFFNLLQNNLWVMRSLILICLVLDFNRFEIYQLLKVWHFQGFGWLATALPHLFDAVPVGLGQVEAAGGGSWLVTHHAQFGDRGEALSSGCHAVLPRVQKPPVVAWWCCDRRRDILFFAVVGLKVKHEGSGGERLRLSVRPVVTSWLIPSTDTVAFAMGFPCWSFTIPLMPRCTYQEEMMLYLGSRNETNCRFSYDKDRVPL